MKRKLFTSPLITLSALAIIIFSTLFCNIGISKANTDGEDWKLVVESSEDPVSFFVNLNALRNRLGVVTVVIKAVEPTKYSKAIWQIYCKLNYADILLIQYYDEKDIPTKRIDGPMRVVEASPTAISSILINFACSQPQHVKESNEDSIRSFSHGEGFSIWGASSHTLDSILVDYSISLAPRKNFRL